MRRQNERDSERGGSGEGEIADKDTGTSAEE